MQAYLDFQAEVDKAWARTLGFRMFSMTLYRQAAGTQQLKLYSLLHLQGKSGSGSYTHGHTQLQVSSKVEPLRESQYTYMGPLGTIPGKILGKRTGIYLFSKPTQTSVESLTHSSSGTGQSGSKSKNCNAQACRHCSVVFL